MSTETGRIFRRISMSDINCLLLSKIADRSEYIDQTGCLTISQLFALVHLRKVRVFSRVVTGNKEAGSKKAPWRFNVQK